jgi:hypothetical protein
MRITCSVIFISLLVSCLFGPPMAQATPTGLSFFPGDLESLRQEAANRQIPYFLYFGIPQDSECQKIETRSFHYKPLIQYVKGRYLAYQVNGTTDPHARQLISHYQIEGFPTILVFGPEGEKWDQLFGYVAGNDLQRRLQALLENGDNQVPEVTWEDAISDESADVAEIDLSGTAASAPVNEVEIIPLDPVAVTAEPVPSQERAAVVIAPQEVQVKQEPAVSQPEPEVQLDLRQEVSSQETETMSPLLVRYDPAHRGKDMNFGIKIAEFYSLAQLESAVGFYERVWWGDIFSYKEIVRGKDIYTLILGAYETLEEADAHAMPMQKMSEVEPQVIEFEQLLSGL